MYLVKKNERESQLTRDFQIGSLERIQGEGNDRKFLLSFSSEEPYNRCWGVEVLDHSDGAVDIKRISEIGCVLFNHNRDYVIGKIHRVWIENGRGNAEIEFDTDDEAEKIYQKVKSGTLKGVSVGYKVDSWEEVLPGKTSADGKYTGPVSIARKWTPLEISIVSVPADPSVGVGRELEKEHGRTLAIYEWQLQINKNLN